MKYLKLLIIPGIRMLSEVDFNMASIKFTEKVFLTEKHLFCRVPVGGRRFAAKLTAPFRRTSQTPIGFSSTSLAHGL